ncbi:CmpA/NrtA family ABC transporter substrate-binding protein [Rhizobium halophytocola]|uniref:NitT/TauT family transport system ATP-binding protein n=1 Tax=Rhizobium halophytocola TaxID=735519 RepID=A0ABS4DXL3_9HYPH|nr:CmpA/NrtA family ABC transporter substrate-binding protein [Rhizobium halophytocola]MBP1850433.1 NitT/TauT family transport system ATP-binding protein [Rhizobium halophytocola]
MANAREMTVGFMPLFDSCILIAAAEKGFASDENLDLHLMRETSWASIRDRIAVGHFQAAHMLGPMPIAANLGLHPMAAPMICPMALNLGGNAITVSKDLHAGMLANGHVDDLEPHGAGRALKATIAARRAEGRPALRFAVVHFHSGHNYELRYWLSACGISPDSDVEIVAVPPSLMPDALELGRIDGYCVGEPWNTISVDRDIGRIVAVKARIWRNSPEKVLGVSKPWADDNRDLLDALLRACYRAAQWCGNPENIEELAGIMAAPQHLGVEGRLLLPELTGRINPAPGVTVPVEDFLVLSRRAATFPWQSHALWFYSQMVRWGDCRHSAENAEIARNSYRPDIFRQALKPIFAAMPAANLKVEGALTVEQDVGTTAGRLTLGPDGFFDGKIFDPDRLEEYIASQMPGFATA